MQNQRISFFSFLTYLAEQNFIISSLEIQHNCAIKAWFLVYSSWQLLEDAKEGKRNDDVIPNEKKGHIFQVFFFFFLSKDTFSFNLDLFSFL